MTTHYETLRVSREADADAVKRAFRIRARETHPDFAGGDLEEMKAVNRAYEVLSDPARRRHYDETGQDSVGPSIEEEARSAVLKVFSLVLEDDADWLTVAREAMTRSRGELQAQIAAATAKRGRLVKRRDKVRTKDGAENLLHMLVDQQVRGLAGHLALLERGLLVQACSLRLLDAYESDPDEMAELQRAAFATMESIAFGGPFGTTSGKWHP